MLSVRLSDAIECYWVSVRRGCSVDLTTTSLQRLRVTQSQSRVSLLPVYTNRGPAQWARLRWDLFTLGYLVAVRLGSTYGVGRYVHFAKNNQGNRYWLCWLSSANAILSTVYCVWFFYLTVYLSAGRQGFEKLTLTKVCTKISEITRAEMFANFHTFIAINSYRIQVTFWLKSYNPTCYFP